MSLDLMERPQSGEALSARQWQPRQARQPLSRHQSSYSDVSSAARLEAIPFGDHALVFEQPLPSWSHPLLMEISELGDLRSGWDSYGARPVAAECAAAAAEFILNLLDEHTPKPAIVPTTRGSIQFEWHRAGADLEIEIVSPTKLQVFFEDDRNGKQKEFPLSANCLPLLPLLHRMK